MKIEVNIEPQLEELWNIIGLSKREMQSELRDVKVSILQHFQKIVNDWRARVDDLTNKVEEVEEELITFHRNCGSKEKLRINMNNTLNDRYDYAMTKLTDLKKRSARNIENYDLLYDALTKLFDILEIENRGTFAEKGTKFTPERIAQTAELVDKMKEVVDERSPLMDALYDEVKDLHYKLRMKPVKKPKQLSDRVFQSMEADKNTCQDLYKSLYNTKRMTIRQIRKFEKVAEQEPVLLDETECVDQKEVDHLLEMLEKFEHEKDAHLPEFIKHTKDEIESLWKELHIFPPDENQFPEFYNGEDTIETLDRLEFEVENLDKYRDETEVLRKLCQQRNKIIDDSRKKPSKTVSFQQVLANNKRLAEDLPILNQKLEEACKQYEETHGKPFLWDNINVYQRVTNPKLKLAKIRAVPRQKEIPKSPTSPSRSNINSPTKSNLNSPSRLSSFSSSKKNLSNSRTVTSKNSVNNTPKK